MQRPVACNPHGAIGAPQESERERAMSLCPADPPAALQIDEFDATGEVPMLDVDLDLPMLLLWEHVGPEIDVRAGSTRWRRYRPRAGTLDLYAPGRYSYCSSSGRRHYLFVRVDPQWWRSVPLLQSRIQFQDRALARMVRQSRTHFIDGEPLGARYSELLSHGIVDRLASGGGRLEHCAIPELDAGLRCLLEELIDLRLEAPPSAAEMLALSSMSGSDFLKAFKTSFGMSPHQYVLHRRVERAKELLPRDTSLSDIASRLGFATHSHFTTVFRARTGTTPSDYRRAMPNIRAHEKRQD
jgi:AraC family transcriptional regulator